MSVSIIKIERVARYVMGCISVFALLAWGAFEQGWISAMPSYKSDAWYLVGGNTRFVVTSEYGDEAACRRAENASAVCLKGKTLMEEMQRNQMGG